MTAWPFAHIHQLSDTCYPQPFGHTPACDTLCHPAPQWPCSLVSGVRSAGLPLAGLALLASQGCSQVADWVQEGSPPKLLQPNIRVLSHLGLGAPPTSGRCQAGGCECECWCASHDVGAEQVAFLKGGGAWGVWTPLLVPPRHLTSSPVTFCLWSLPQPAACGLVVGVSPLTLWVLVPSCLRNPP